MMLAPVRALAVLLFLGAGSALAQELAQDAGTQNRAASTVDTTPPGTLEKVTLPPLANPDAPNIPAKELFARKLTPLAGPARAIGGYAKGCMAGAEELPITGPTWQVMRLSRNRNWGNPELIDFIKRFGDNAKKAGWNGLLIGDMAQPRGGPMLSGHASHQIGLDADIWFSPMPDHVLSREEREMTGAVNMVAPSGLDVDHSVWTPVHTALVKAAAEDPRSRVFSSTPRSRRQCAARPVRIALGLLKCGRGGGMPSTSTFGSTARPTARNASRSRRCRPAMAAAMRSITGSPLACCIRSRRKSRPDRGPDRRSRRCRRHVSRS